MDVYLEVGKKRAVAAAVAWPGWCRFGRDEESALEALREYGVRYGRVAHAAHLQFKSPADTAAFTVVERFKGSAMTDFGGLEAIPTHDEQTMDDDELARSRALLRAAWRAFDHVVEAAHGKTLTTGPRGGGRELEKIVEHVIDVDSSHLGRLGVKYVPDSKETVAEQLVHLREAMIDALAASVRGDIERRGPRGGKRIPAHFFVRRSLWHVLDHVWEIEDRAAEKG